jgi:hypothetical protein
LDEFDTLLHNIGSGPILRKLKHPPLTLNVTSPLFSFNYNKLLHSKNLCKDLDLSYLDTTLQQTIYALIKIFWPVFNNCGVFVLVKNYKCIIDTVNAPPIVVKKIQYSPKEIPIVRTTVSALKSVAYIHQIHNCWWLFKAVLAPKPQQEHVKDIKDFIWRSCINYVPLNSFTQIIAYQIPCCNSAVSEEFGTGLWMWLYGAPSGYYQLTLALASQEKLAFQWPDTIKWTYTVMPFGPTNGPVTFVNFIYNIDSQWKLLAHNNGINIKDNANTCIVIDNIVSHGKDLSTSLLYMECQLWVCMAYHLLLSLKKNQCFEFFGNNVCPEGNRPAQSKHQLLQTWPQPEIVCDVAKFIDLLYFIVIIVLTLNSGF